MKFNTKLKPTLSLIDLTPLVDVIFLMLIFFVVTSSILPLKSLDIENPTLDKEAPPLMTQVLVVMDAHNVLYVGSKKAIHDLASLSEALEGEVERLIKQGGTSNPTVVLSLDRKVPYDLFLKLFSRVMELGYPVRLSYKSHDDPL